jgi:hypothetical protein
MFRRLRGLLHAGMADAGVAQPAVGSAARRALNARCHGLLSQLLWARAWLGRYETSDYPRVASAMADLLLHGLAAPGQTWPARPMPAPEPVPGDAAAEGDTTTREAYLRTATRLVNDHGVGGASVERIAATLEGDSRPLSFQGGNNPAFGPARGLVDYVPTDASASEVTPRRIVTSGLGGVFPAGLFIGEITRLETSTDGLFKTGEVRLESRLAELTEVTVLVPERAD